MPVTVNAPNFWDLTLDNFINKSNRNPNPDGSYSFQGDELDTNNVDPYKNRQYLPEVKGRKINPKRIYNNIMDAMESEAENEVIPYNTAPINEQQNPDILDAVREWIARGGNRHIK